MIKQKMNFTQFMSELHRVAEIHPSAVVMVSGIGYVGGFPTDSSEAWNQFGNNFGLKDDESAVIISCEPTNPIWNQVTCYDLGTRLWNWKLNVHNAKTDKSVRGEKVKVIICSAQWSFFTVNEVRYNSFMGCVEIMANYSNSALELNF